MSTISITIVFDHGNPTFNLTLKIKLQNLLYQTQTQNIVLMPRKEIVKQTIPQMMVLILGRRQVLNRWKYNMQILGR